MAVKVLKLGKAPQDRTYSAECHRCKSEVEWHHSDAVRVHTGDLRDPAPFTQIKCPICGNTLTGY